MTEEEWLTTELGNLLLDSIDRADLAGRGASRTRTLRLMRCSAFRLAWNEMPDDLLRQAVVVAEMFADGECTLNMVHQTTDDLLQAAHWLKSPFVDGSIAMLDPKARRRARDYNPQWVPGVNLNLARGIRDIIGNPFRPVSFSPDWRTSTAVAIAQSMYESRDFGPMPLLADALQDAGCEVPEVLDHCREPGPHVRGCWVVDGVLGKGVTRVS